MLHSPSPAPATVPLTSPSSLTTFSLPWHSHPLFPPGVFWIFIMCCLGDPAPHSWKHSGGRRTEVSCKTLPKWRNASPCCPGAEISEKQSYPPEKVLEVTAAQHAQRWPVQESILCHLLSFVAPLQPASPSGLVTAQTAPCPEVCISVSTQKEPSLGLSVVLVAQVVSILAKALLVMGPGAVGGYISAAWCQHFTAAAWKPKGANCWSGPQPLPRGRRK